MYPRLVTYGAQTLPSGSVALSYPAGTGSGDPRG